MIWESKFNIGDRVYLRLADENHPGYILQVAFDGGVAPRYLCVWGDRSGTWHAEFELADVFVSNYSEQQ